MYIAREPGSTPCQNNDPEIWHAREDTHITAQAKALCGLCPERLACLSSVMRHEKRVGYTQPSVYAGLTSTERRRLYLQPAAVSA